MGVTKNDLTGKRFGALVVTGRAGFIGRDAAWQVRCEACGSSKAMRRCHIVGYRGRPPAKSCGCLGRGRNRHSNRQPARSQPVVEAKAPQAVLDTPSTLTGPEVEAIERWLRQGNRINRVENGQWRDSGIAMSEWAKKRQRLAAKGAR